MQHSGWESTRFSRLDTYGMCILVPESIRKRRESGSVRIGGPYDRLHYFSGGTVVGVYTNVVHLTLHRPAPTPSSPQPRLPDAEPETRRLTGPVP